MSKENYKEENRRLLAEKKLDEILDKERDINKQLYAIKLVEKIVFALVGVLTLGVIYAFLNIVFKNNVGN